MSDRSKHGKAAVIDSAHRNQQASDRFLRMLCECSQALVHATSENQLIQDVCSITVDVGGYVMAWVGYGENDPGKTVRPVVAAGAGVDYLDNIRVSWGDDEHGRGPTGTAIRTGEVSFGRDFLKDPKLDLWRKPALERGFNSSIALPLTAGGRTFGALSIYAAMPDAFDDAQTAALRDLADDLTFGIMAIRARNERDRAQHELEQRAALLKALAAELRQAELHERQRLAQLLHDHLQQLLVGAKLSAETLKKKAESKSLREGLARISEVLKEAIDASRSLTAELSPPVLHERGFTAGLAWLARHMHEHYGLTVEVTADREAEPAADSVRLLLFDSVRELLFNVVKHSGVKEACVRVKHAGSGSVQVTVSDQGKGFDPRSLEVSGAAGGFGLGSIRRRLAFGGGEMTIGSSPGHGSVFVLTVPPQETPAGSAPCKPVEAAKPEDTRSDKRAGTEGRIRVLLADDHKSMREWLAAVLEEEPDILVVGQASDGEETVEMAGRLSPDVILMDVSMPKVDGIEATRRIIAQSPGAYVIGLSLHDAADMSAVMHEAGAKAYLTKDGPTEELIAAIRGKRQGMGVGD